jgi:hypothetical protein
MGILDEFDGREIVDECVELSQEKGAVRRPGHCKYIMLSAQLGLTRFIAGIIRALNWFVFVKNGQVISPCYQDCTTQFWQGVEVYGFVASLTGPPRYHLMAGLWSYAWGGKHFEVMHIREIIGLHKEKDLNWRGG